MKFEFTSGGISEQGRVSEVTAIPGVESENGEPRRLFTIPNVSQYTDATSRIVVSTDKGSPGKDERANLGLPTPEAAAPSTQTGNEGGNGKPPEGKELGAASEMPRGIEVRIGESFPLYPNDRRTTIPENEQWAYYSPHVLLVTPMGDLIRFRAAADYLAAESEVNPPSDFEPSFMPFRPETGYRIDNKDFDPSTGFSKYREWKRSFDPMTTDRLPLWVYHHGEETPISENSRRILEGLQLQVEVNGLNFLSDIEKKESSGEIVYEFSVFYPTDTGPLPYVPNGGVQLCLPDNIAKLSTIRGKFILPKIK